MALPPPGWRRDLVVALLFALFAAAVRFPGLGFPKDEYFDEVYHAKAARHFLEGEIPVEWVHPPTAKLLIAVGVKSFGYVSWAWRLAPAFAGSLLAAVFFLLARSALATERAAVLATVLLLADGVYLVQSRVAMTNIFAVLFQVAAALCVLRAGNGERLRTSWMLLLGACLGLALSTRWTSLWATAFLGLVLLALRRARIFRPRELGLTLAAFVLLPVFIYAASYVPLVRPGHLRIANPRPNNLSTFEDLARGARDLVEEQRQVFRYHANLTDPHPYFSEWWKWPWLVRPTWYFYEQKGETVRGIIAIGNPALWWASVPVTLFTLVGGVRARDPRRLFAALGFLGLYLPWGLSPRTLNFGHYLFEALPYACLSLGLLLDRAWDGPARVFARAYVVLVVLLFAHFLPFLTAMPVPASWFFFEPIRGGPKPWSWFPTWI